MNCWSCVEERIVLPFRSNPKGIMGGAIVMVCGDCRTRINKIPERPWEK